MLHVKYVEDFEQIQNEKMRDWLKAEHPFIPVKDGDSGFNPDDHGWLIVLDDNASVDALDTGITALDNLLEVECWEFVIYNPLFHVWLATVVIGDGFGMAIAIPDFAIRHSSLRETLTEIVET